MLMYVEQVLSEFLPKDVVRYCILPFFPEREHIIRELERLIEEKSRLPATLPQTIYVSHLRFGRSGIVSIDFIRNGEKLKPSIFALTIAATCLDHVCNGNPDLVEMAADLNLVILARRQGNNFFKFTFSHKACA
jgi:hypothetical protein